MKRKQVKKLWLGKFVSVRDYELKDAIREGGLIIEHDGEQMRMSVEDVKQITPSGKFHKAKFAGNIQSYQLCDITWKPSNDEQKEMFQMNLEKFATPATIEAIYKYYKDKRKNEHRPHLGGSQIGNECSRALWYQFRHAWSPSFDGRMLRLFETGDREEDRIVSNLRGVGVTVWERDPETGKQVRFTECGGHFALSLDGVGLGFSESKKPHTLEFKTMSEKNFKAMKNLGCQKSKPVYWAQCQIGMHLAELDRCYFFCVNKNTDEIYGERIKLDKKEAKGLVDKANKIVFADTPAWYRRSNC